ncbi:MAG: hypothetical protein HRT44_08380 [Bdellovibrionales bacterium]|nr:hypothetical protein [Bdellovibrionales bacterium]NQZ19256.1 hypothetical protein [Bdellovibrionales bacterium]
MYFYIFGKIIKHKKAQFLNGKTWKISIITVFSLFIVFSRFGTEMHGLHGLHGIDLEFLIYWHFGINIGFHYWSYHVLYQMKDKKTRDSMGRILTDPI